MLLEVVDWLSPTEVVLDQDAALSTRENYPSTGSWILQTDKIRTWRAADIPSHPKIWISGKPGAGIVTLCLAPCDDSETDDCLQEKRSWLLLSSTIASAMKHLLAPISTAKTAIATGTTFYL
jgi:hypothetical protein